jgi:hypothetical protein
MRNRVTGGEREKEKKERSKWRESKRNGVTCGERESNRKER